MMFPFEIIFRREIFKPKTFHQLTVKAFWCTFSVTFVRPTRNRDTDIHWSKEIW